MPEAVLRKVAAAHFRSSVDQRTHGIGIGHLQQSEPLLPDGWIGGAAGIMRMERLLAKQVVASNNQQDISVLTSRKTQMYNWRHYRLCHTQTRNTSLDNKLVVLTGLVIVQRVKIKFKRLQTLHSIGARYVLLAYCFVYVSWARSARRGFLTFENSCISLIFSSRPLHYGIWAV